MRLDSRSIDAKVSTASKASKARAAARRFGERCFGSGAAVPRWSMCDWAFHAKREVKGEERG